MIPYIYEEKSILTDFPYKMLSLYSDNPSPYNKSQIRASNQKWMAGDYKLTSSANSRVGQDTYSQETCFFDLPALYFKAEL